MQVHGMLWSYPREIDQVHFRSSQPAPLCIGLLIGKSAQHVVGQCPRCCLACASGREYGVHLD